MCYYEVITTSGETLISQFDVNVLPLNGDHLNITFTLPPNKYYNVTLIAHNGYGNATITVFISKPSCNHSSTDHYVAFIIHAGTFELYGIYVNASELRCMFYPGSLARGCLAYLMNTATGAVYCRIVARSADTLVNMSLCLPFSNGPLSAGVYSVVVYDIKSDGSLSPTPAITGSMVTIIGSSPSTSFTSFILPSMCSGHYYQ